MSIIPKTIGDLKDHRFFVPSYQRGYRWTEQEALALLNDVHEFSTEGGKQYCIQPLIVKRRDNGSYEVVDGQQRLTTIFIFLKIVEEKTEYPPFELEYETREKSQFFLSGLVPKGDINKENIDYFHITTVREAINNWLDGKNRTNAETPYIRINAVTKMFSKFTESVFFIWYEIPSDRDPNDLFTKVNMGKIQLTNAELIKALLLKKDNFNKDKNKRQIEINEINKRQVEISLAWDRIEQGLHDDSFWYFLNEKEQSGTRIDMLFALLADEYNAILPKPVSENQNYFPFSVFWEVLKSEPDKEEFVETLWNKVEELYAEFHAWYADLDKYHIIGYLISSGVTIKDIFKITHNERKHKIEKKLIGRAAEIKTFDRIPNLTYDNSGDRKIIRQLLLLFNIATLVCKSEKQYRFPFDIYKRETENKPKWSIEHIHATADKTDEADDSMGNLTLLDKQTNSSYQDAPFNDKRDIIIERESKGLFIPLCTKNVFLKVYSKKTDEMDMWNDEDKKDYIDAIEHTLKLFFDMKDQI